MNIFILFIATVLVFKILFNNFGILSKKDNIKKEDAINNFTKNNNVFKENGYLNCSIAKLQKNNLKLNNKIEVIPDKKTVEVFDEKKFIKEAERLAVFVMDAITKKDFLLLTQLLTKEILYKISNIVLNFEKLNKKYISTIISLESKIININDTKTAITLDMDISKIEYIENDSKEIISGSKDKIIKVNEKWTFVRKLVDNKNIWLLNSISI